MLTPIFKSKFSTQEKTFFCEIPSEFLTEENKKFSKEENNKKPTSQKNQEPKSNKNQFVIFFFFFFLIIFHYFNIILIFLKKKYLFLKKTLNFHHGFKALAVSPNEFGKKEGNNEEFFGDLVRYGNLGGLLVIELRKNI